MVSGTGQRYPMTLRDAPGMFQRAEGILGALHSAIADLYAEIADDGDPTAINLVRSALDRIVYLENLPISHSTDISAYRRAADDAFDLLRRSQDCLTSKAP
jgi:hypothetical protein